LTIDCRIQKICEDAAEEMLPVGAIIVQDISTGDIKACVSMPTYSVTDVASAMDAENSPLINRAFTAYNVGSVFKLCVAAAAIESGIDTDYEYECTGKITLGSTSYNCNNRNGHGVLDMTGGLCNSCNTYFINLALKTGASAIFQMAEKMGFGRSKELCSSIISASGNMPSLDELQNHIGELANFAFGQGKLLATPLQISGMVTAIANGGLYLEPSLVLGTTDSDGEITVTRKVESERIMSSKTAAKLREMMIQVVENGTGKNAGISAGAGGKTASAETGWIINGESATQCWFSGFFPAENSKYTVTVLAENGSSGSSSAAPVFAKIAESIIQLDL
ncbi:MAG: peptidoglycan D,D-transpeptidase FtsI family protein, partial [Acutalibacteraceae bacterium]